MIKRLFGLAFLLFFCLQLNAQRFNGGLKVGANFTQVDGDGNSGFHKAGFTGGGFINYSFTERVMVQGELLFSQKGAIAKPTKDNPDGEFYTIKDNYFDIPILLGIQIYKNFWGMAGIMPSVLVTGIEEMDDEERTDQPGFSAMDFGVVGGFTYRFWKGFSASLNWSYSLINIRDGVSNDYKRMFGNYGQYNNVVSLTFQYHFR